MKEKVCKHCGNTYMSRGIDPCSRSCMKCCYEQKSLKEKEYRDELQEELEKWELYVRLKIEADLKEVRAIICEECGRWITDVYQEGMYGGNVAHLISKWDKSFYYIRENSIYLCQECHWNMDRVDPASMKIWEDVKEAQQFLRKNKEQFLDLPYNKIFYNEEYKKLIN
jgi:hypothetical protein